MNVPSPAVFHYTSIVKSAFIFSLTLFLKNFPLWKI
jgi:hypothetical protein